MRRSVPGPLDPSSYGRLIRDALAEDIRSGDVTTEAIVPPGVKARGVLEAKKPCVLAGLDIAVAVFRQLDPDIEVVLQKHDGGTCIVKESAGEIRGLARALLTGERTALNILQRLSGIATLTRKYVEAAQGRLTILDTRKTTPTMRALEKYAVRVGGGCNHRLGLDDAVLIKDNHIRLAGGVTEALRRAERMASHLPIEIEVETLEQLEQALAAGATRVLLDNFSPGEIREAVRHIGGRATVEISGGVTLESISELIDTGATFVSIGALTHSAPAADISFEIDPT